ncbi:Hypothetical predicted protein [Podarcis lilfordi]|uniref:Uncharacterized protein n=1 Tax=Podarcis lilfordi TaxID=74358 RepID=A0AA35K8A2_9SAUR|nr:Hypothetical predicted protein [Podarcis lilfordi]
MQARDIKTVAETSLQDTRLFSLQYHKIFLVGMERWNSSIILKRREETERRKC